jgi:hypothetical protein
MHGLWRARVVPNAAPLLVNVQRRAGIEPRRAGAQDTANAVFKLRNLVHVDEAYTQAASRGAWNAQENLL